jgi:hypothetical protein
VIRQARNSILAPDYAFNIKINNFLQEITSILNDSFTEETTLSGVASNQKASLDLTTLGALPSTSPADTSYYVGGHTHMTVSLNTTYTFDAVPLSATHPAIEKTIRACRMCLNTDFMNPLNPQLVQALTLVEESQGMHYPEAITIAGLNTQFIEKVMERSQIRKESLVGQAQAAGVENVMDVLQAYLENQATMDMSRTMAIQQLQILERLSQQMGNSF